MSDNRKKILIVGMTAGVGGVETFICNLIKFLDKEKFEINLLTHQDINKKYYNIIKENDIKVYKVIGIKSGIWKYLKEIFKFYKMHKYDIIHLNECGASFFVYVLPILFNKKTKLIVHSHNGDSSNRWLHYFFRFIQNKRADLKFACSDVAAKWMYGKKAKKVLIIHNGIDVEKYKFNKNIRNMIRKELDIEKKFVIGSVARFEEQKNHKKIIDIYYEYYTQINKNSCLILVGEGSKKNEIEKYVCDRKLQNNVIFLGLRDDICNLLMGFDIFILPSLYEGLPFVVVEAQTSSLPILSSDTVSNQINLTQIVFWEKLNSDNLVWAKKIEKIRLLELNRNDNSNIKKIIKKGYDIRNVVKIIENEYIKISNK